MKYTDLTLEQICCAIKSSRPNATIYNKIHGLLAYNKVLGRRQISDSMSNAAKYLQRMEATGKKPKLPKSIRESLFKQGQALVV